MAKTESKRKVGAFDPSGLSDDDSTAPAPKHPNDPTQFASDEAPAPQRPEPEPMPAPTPPIPDSMDQMLRKQHVVEVVSGLLANPNIRLTHGRIEAVESQQERDAIVKQGIFIVDTIEKAMAK